MWEQSLVCLKRSLLPKVPCPLPVFRGQLARDEQYTSHPTSPAIPHLPPSDPVDAQHSNQLGLGQDWLPRCGTSERLAAPGGGICGTHERAPTRIAAHSHCVHAGALGCEQGRGAGVWSWRPRGVGWGWSAKKVLTRDSWSHLHAFSWSCANMSTPHRKAWSRPPGGGANEARIARGAVDISRLSPVRIPKPEHGKTTSDSLSFCCANDPPLSLLLTRRTRCTVSSPTHTFTILRTPDLSSPPSARVAPITLGFPEPARSTAASPSPCLRASHTRGVWAP